MDIPIFTKIISRLPSDPIKVNSGKWYKTQKEHWLGWLREYQGPGAYGRNPNHQHDARFVYNHIVCPEMLLYLIKSLGVEPEIVNAAEQACQQGATQMQQSGAVRKIVPWSMIEEVISSNKV